jgi:hypothetical protein
MPSVFHSISDSEDNKAVAKKNREAIRGLLIFFVILDHNDIIRSWRPVNAWFLPMTFHVVSFLTLPFLARNQVTSRNSILDMFARYLVPFYLALLAYSVLFHCLVSTNLSSFQSVLDFAKASIICDPWSIARSSGFVALWFLPAFFSINIIISKFFKTTVAIYQKVIFVIFSLVLHISVGIFPFYVKSWVPEGILIALFIFPVGLMLRYLTPRIVGSRYKSVFTSIFIALLIAAWDHQKGREIEIALLILPSFVDISELMISDAANVIFILLIFINSNTIRKLLIFREIGRYSLLIYLLHPILYKPIFICLSAVVPTDFRIGIDASYFFWSAFSVVLVTLASWLVAHFINSYSCLQSLITPSSWTEWLPIKVFRSL